MQQLPSRADVVAPVREAYPLAENVEVISPLMLITARRLNKNQG